MSRFSHRREAAVVAALLLAACSGIGQAQQTPANAPVAPSNAQLQEEVKLISDQLAATQRQLQQSQEEVLKLQQQLAAIQAQLGVQPAAATTAETEKPATPTEEKIAVVEAQVKLHEQVKVESVSKYQVRFTGLILFNSFFNKGIVDNLDLPSVAFQPTAGNSTLTSGATMRQTLLGVQARGPKVFGAESSGEVNFDFYGGFPYTNYSTAAGLVRLRTAGARLTWPRDVVEVGFTAPLVSPLEPTSYATVAEPAMAWAGNLWTWAPQMSYTHAFGERNTTHAQWQFGLWDPPSSGYNPDQLFRSASPGERSGQPGYEMRLALVNEGRGASGVQIGLGGYYSRQHTTTWNGDSWAVTSDVRLPMGRVFELSGEAYRGRELGGLGGGAYKDALQGNDLISGASVYRLLNDAGGWAQAKMRFTPVLETNATFGIDNAFARDFHSVVLPVGASATALRARNHMATVNLIYTPKTYIILSPEYRRIWTWGIFGPASTANIMTMSFGLRF